jgi:hypothetical protein
MEEMRKQIKEHNQTQLVKGQAGIQTQANL